MDRQTLADRVRAVLGTPMAPVRETPVVSALETSNTSIAEQLGGDWAGEGGERFLVVQRRREPGERHGWHSVGELAKGAASAADAARLLWGSDDVRSPVVFFDLETTGLSGGAGTLAFLVGCGWFDTEGGFITRQYLLTRTSNEPDLLDRVAGEFHRAGGLVSFNGKSFDAPILETRYLFHRRQWPAGALPHLDVLHSARRFWRDDGGCSLGVLEAQVLGAERQGDIAGFEIPGRYFQFLRDGDGGPLIDVLEHNRLDLLSLAGLTARLLHLAVAGASAVRDAREALALGGLYARAGERARAVAAFERSAAADAAPEVRAAALRALAVDARRDRSFDVAARYWRHVLDVQGCPAGAAREAARALAIHHEHRAGDLDAARNFALRSLALGERPSWTRAVHHRLARLERKLERASKSPLLD
jgi:uncharacterized protein YprB with RNaseH-like and TPR domain